MKILSLFFQSPDSVRSTTEVAAAAKAAAARLTDGHGVTTIAIEQLKMYRVHTLENFHFLHRIYFSQTSFYKKCLESQTYQLMRLSILELRK